MSEKILAVSAGHEITEQELKDLIANYPPEQQIYLSSPQAKDEVLEQLIGFYLFAKMAEEEKIKESKEYKETLAKMENELASHMAATSVIDKVTLEDGEAKAFYDNNPAQFTADAQVKAKHILVEKEEDANKIADEIKARVDFHQHNLLKDVYPTDCDLIVCRNVLIYFTEEAKDEVFRKYYQSLAKGGMLFIGSTEQIMNYREIGFDRKSSFYYVKPM